MTEFVYQKATTDAWLTLMSEARKAQACRPAIADRWLVEINQARTARLQAEIDRIAAGFPYNARSQGR